MPQTNQTAELLAVWHAVQAAPTGAQLHIKTDSRYVIDNLTTHLKKREEQGWIGLKNKDLFKTTVALLKRRGNITTFQWIKGHSGIKGNEEADKLAKAGAQKDAENTINLRIPQRFNLTGAQLTKATQALLTKGIKERKSPKGRRTSSINLDKTRWAVKEIYKTSFPSDEIIWTNIQHKDFSKAARVFMYKTMHGGYKIGKYWENINGYENRGVCPLCENEEESMEHILLECNSPERKIIWNLARDLLKMKGIALPELRIGSILGCGLAEVRDSSNKLRPGASRLIRIVISESAHMIWTIRCERRIQNADADTGISENAIANKWIYRMNTRLTTDRLCTDRRYGTKALKPETVLQTWSGTLLAEENLPENWLRQSGVLVGISPRSSSRDRGR